MRDGELRTYLRLIAGQDDNGWIELRHRALGAMRSEFHRVTGLEALEQRVRVLGKTDDVYLGVAVRSRRAATKDAVAHSWLVWADCDSPEAVARLRRVAPAPTLVIASGSRGHAHAYWLLRHPVSPGVLEDLNRRLAAALGADPACTDAGRILRPPETWNHKGPRPSSVRTNTPVRPRAYDVAQFAHLPVPAVSRSSMRSAPRRTVSDDPLAAISAVEYVPRLSGHDVDRTGKTTCPFHDDRTPSLHAYDDPKRGWYCYGCGKGGSIYDFAAALRGVEPRGAAFLDLRDELLQEFGLADPLRRRPAKGLSRPF